MVTAPLGPISGDSGDRPGSPLFVTRSGVGCYYGALQRTEPHELKGVGIADTRKRRWNDK